MNLNFIVLISASVQNHVVKFYNYYQIAKI